MNEVQEIVRKTITRHSYFLSDACIEAIAEQVEKHYAEAVEKAWQYDELCD